MGHYHVKVILCIVIVIAIVFSAFFILLQKVEDSPRTGGGGRAGVAIRGRGGSKCLGYEARRYRACGYLARIEKLMKLSF